jgi:hypothetical protein
LVEALHVLPAQANWASLGLWLGGVFAETGKRVAFSPALNAVRQTSAPIDGLLTPSEAQAFAHRFVRFIPDFRVYSQRYGWTPDETYQVRAAGVGS